MQVQAVRSGVRLRQEQGAQLVTMQFLHRQQPPPIEKAPSDSVQGRRLPKMWVRPLRQILVLPPPWPRRQGVHDQPRRLHEVVGCPQAGTG